MFRVRLAANWDTTVNIITRLLTQFKTPDIDLSRIEFVTGNSYDMLVSFNHISTPVNQNTPSFVFPHEPIWSGSHQKNFTAPTVVFGFNKEDYSGTCIETLAHTFYGGRGPWVDSLSVWSYDNLCYPRTFLKNKGISSSITHLNTSQSLTCLYPQRFTILNEIETLPFVDLFGSTKSSDTAQSSPKKIDAVANYRFNIAIENDYSNNWLTEKFYDAILTETVPIYYGCKNIRDIYPEDGYIIIEDINSPARVKQQLLDIHHNADVIYLQKLKGLREIKRRYFSEYNLLRKIVSLC